MCMYVCVCVHVLACIAVRSTSLFRGSLTAAVTEEKATKIAEVTTAPAQNCTVICACALVQPHAEIKPSVLPVRAVRMVWPRCTVTRQAFHISCFSQ